MANTKQFQAYLNHVMPGGAMVLACSETEFKKFVLELMRGTEADQQIKAARVVGLNNQVWVFSPSVYVSANGEQLSPDDSPVIWLDRPAATKVLINTSLSCSIAIPLDAGNAFAHMCMKIQEFMPENLFPTIATLSAAVMAATCSQPPNLLQQTN